jgi:3-hydroxybutyryl-CoA dehydrogenase
MPMAEIQRVGIAGAGTMGSGIAEVAALAGLAVVLYDAAAGQVERSRSIIAASLEKGVRRSTRAASERDAALARITPAASLTALAGCDFVIEAVREHADTKRAVHAELGRLSPPATVLASNTSSISISALGEASGRPDRFVGMHFFNPVPVLPLVEVIRGRATSDATLAITDELARRMGKTPLCVNDAPGFVANRVLMPMINEAIFALAENVADAATIDRIMVLGCAHPMGPLALADLIGLDVCLSILEVLERDTGDAKFRPCPMLRDLVAAGRCGRKSGRGFFDYSLGSHGSCRNS